MNIFISETLLNESSNSIKDISFELVRQTRQEFIIGASSSKIFDAGNKKILLNFTIERSHSSENDANFFTICHSSEVEELLSDDFFIFFDNLKVKLIDCTISKISSSVDGIISNTKYQFVAQKIQTQTL